MPTRSLEDIATTGAAWITEVELEKLIAIAQAAKKYRKARRLGHKATILRMELLDEALGALEDK